MILNNQDQGRTVEVKAQSVVTVRLDENPSTGYRWNIEADEGLELVVKVSRDQETLLGQEAYEYSSLEHWKLDLIGLVLENGVIGKEKIL
jgi:predicted secreted protein